ncbi:uncharacterized protein LOC144638249 [Oculina patagonica]
MAAKEQEEKLSVFELAQKLLAEGRELLEKDLNSARQEKAAIEEITKTLNQIHFASTIKLNVGGKIYKTTLDTLRKDPDSMLCAMFSGRFELKADEEDGAYFIDRDAELFRYILNYLRNGELLCPDDKIRKELLAEAKFFQVQGIVSQLEEKSPFEGSLIIENEDHHSALKSWLPPNATCSLLFRASTDGNTAADFHRCCDNKGPTLVVIKSGEYIFGGYTLQSWESALKGIPDRKSFLFTLVNPSGNEPVKITPRLRDGGIMCDIDMGPSFGSSTTGYDLVVWNHNASTSLFNLGCGFTCPENASNTTYFTGKNPSEISELEVFKVSLKNPLEL